MIYNKFTPEQLSEIKLNHPHLETVFDGGIVDNTYRVLIARTNGYTHLRIRRLDDAPICNFADMQEIKNMILGHDTNAVQVFPKTSDYINNTNTYHLFTWPDIQVPNLATMYKYN